MHGKNWKKKTGMHPFLFHSSGHVQLTAPLAWKHSVSYLMIRFFLKERKLLIEGSCKPTREQEMLTVTQYGGFFFFNKM